MADRTHIEWTDATWNPITGCSVVSAGCKHCYAMKLAGTRLKHDPSREGLTVDTKAGPVWNGQVRFNRQWLDQPLRWRRPRRIFVCAHGDLFHESVPDEWIAEVFGVMRYAPQHTFQVLTKRPERMLRWLQRCGNGGNLGWITHDGTEPAGAYDGTGMIVGEAKRWPLPNVWLGVSVEDQAAADERIPLLLQCPAAVRWISAEPLLGPIDLEALNCASMDECYDTKSGRGRFNALSGWAWNESPNADGTWADNCDPPDDRGRANGRKGRSYLDWVVAGGESGAGARPMHPDWARSLRDQCAADAVRFLFKQWGEWLPGHHYEDVHRRRDPAPDQSRFECAQWNGATWDIGSPHALDLYDNDALYRVGKKGAGRLLDGVQHDGYPEATHGS